MRIMRISVWRYRSIHQSSFINCPSASALKNRPAALTKIGYVENKTNTLIHTKTKECSERLDLIISTLRRWGAKIFEVLEERSSLQLTFGEFADNHSASRGCDYGGRREQAWGNEEWRIIHYTLSIVHYPLSIIHYPFAGWPLRNPESTKLGLVPFVRLLVLTRKRQ